MLDIAPIQGIIFDYGATIDTNGKHWSEVLWSAYKENRVAVSKSDFMNAYVFGERYLASHPVIQANYTFRDVLSVKTEIQLNWLKEQKKLPSNSKFKKYSLAISNQCYNFVVAVLENAKPILEKLASRYPLVLVSNFYGNIETVLNDFELKDFFNELIESAVVGIRKPDPELFLLGVNALRLMPVNVVVIGDSYEKDIVPAKKLGCQTVWIQDKGQKAKGESPEADAIIYDFKELEDLFFKVN
jgi:putative hydrolase of the HAD superfamily